MSDPSTDTTAPAPAPGILVRLRRPLFALAMLFVLWLVFQLFAPAIFPLVQPDGAGQQAATDFPTAANETPEEKDAKIAALESRIDQMEAKLKTLEDVITGLPKSAEAPDGWESKLAEMQAKLDAMQSEAPADGEDAGRVGQLEAKLKAQSDALNALTAQIASVSASGTHQVAILTAFGQLKDTALRGDAYSSELNRLKALAEHNTGALPLLAALAPFSDKGVSTLASLQAAFEPAAKAALAPEVKPDSLAGNLQSLIRIRKVGAEQTGTDDESVIARAEAALENGNLAQCRKELSALSPPALAAFAAWEKAAAATQTVRETLDALAVAVMQETPPSAPIAAPVPVPAPAEPAAEASAPAPVLQTPSE